MATARSITSRSYPLTLVGGDPDRGPVVTGAPAEFSGNARAAFDDITAGRVSLGMLALLIVLLLAFYLWTSSVQGGG